MRGTQKLDAGCRKLGKNREGYPHRRQRDQAKVNNPKNRHGHNTKKQYTQKKLECLDQNTQDELWFLFFTVHIVAIHML